MREAKNLKGLCTPYLEIRFFVSDGVTHVFSVVDRHESNEAERVIQEVFRQISAMVNEERVMENRPNKIRIT